MKYGQQGLQMIYQTTSAEGQVSTKINNQFPQSNPQQLIVLPDDDEIVEHVMTAFVAPSGGRGLLFRLVAAILGVQVVN